MGPVKRVVSVSIGSAKRDHAVEVELLGERFRISREGTDGSIPRAIERVRELDGDVDAFGMGGIDIYLRAAGRDYYFRDARRISAAAASTPIVCGSGLKGPIEAATVRFMAEDLGLPLAGKRVLLTSAVDRWGLAEALYRSGCDMRYGDLLYVLGIPLIIRSHHALVRFVRTLAPAAVQLPFAWLYPTGDKQDSESTDPRHAGLYRDADIIAGDWQYVRKYMPDDMAGKWVITNTTTPADVEFLRRRGIELLVTSTPRLEGRSFGTNVIEATMIALEGASGPLSADRYMELLGRVGFEPDVQWLQDGAHEAGKAF